MQTKKGIRKTNKRPVPCRLEEAYRTLLDAEAASRGITVSDLVREFILDGLKEEEQETAVFQMFRLLQAQIAQLRRDIQISAETLLSASGVVDEKEAHAWAIKEINAE